MLVKKEKKSCLGKPCRKHKNSAFEGFFFLFAVCGSNQGKAEAGCGKWVELRDRARGQTGRARLECKHPSPDLIWGGIVGHGLGCHFSAIRFWASLLAGYNLFYLCLDACTAPDITAQWLRTGSERRHPHLNPGSARTLNKLLQLFEPLYPHL